MQALTGLSFDKFKDAVKDYTFDLTKPPKNDDAFQQVCKFHSRSLHPFHTTAEYSCLLMPISRAP